MLKLEYYHHPFKIKQEHGKEWIWDDVRKKWVRLTPEEWVRQNFVQYLIKEHNYPAALMAVEKEILLEDQKKRCDIVLYKSGEPWMIIECKEMNIPLDEIVLRQALTYNISMPVTYITITNGSVAYIFKRENGQLLSLSDLPAW
ncbi:MAG TPA: type I restriction enzyme HsdR N-terminal domain-containing protein [Chitinophagaceae bacterium]|nr:type I restriction enzyme HsdR N-terminal domain-containing protein [Chitinophagaceae bacterium]